ncbi:hypothetical protein D3C72_1603200 [compost metagenome]
MVLLVKDVGVGRVLQHAVRILAVFRIGVGQEEGQAAAVERLPVGPRVGALEHAAAGHADIKMALVARIDQHGVHLGSVGGAVLLAAGPVAPHRVVVEARHGLPRGAVVGAAEQPLRRGAGVPGAGFAGVAGSQPEHMVDHAAGLAFGRLVECRRARGLGPVAPAVGGAEHRRTKVAGARGHQHPRRRAGILHDMVDGVAKEGGACRLPVAAGGIAGQGPGTLGGGDQQRDRAGFGERRHHGSCAKAVERWIRV